MSSSDGVYRNSLFRFFGLEKETSTTGLMMNPRSLPQNRRPMSVFLGYEFQPIQVPKLRFVV
jgi:hypothetical protein